MSMGMERDPERSGGNGGEERPKAKKTPLVAAAPTHKPTLEEDLARSFASIGRTLKDTLGAPVGEHWMRGPSLSYHVNICSVALSCHVLPQESRVTFVLLSRCLCVAWQRTTRCCWGTSACCWGFA